MRARRAAAAARPARQGWLPAAPRRPPRQAPGAKRRERVGDRTVTQPPRAARAGRQPIDELLQGGAIEIPHPDLAVEVGQREGDQQATVLTARIGAHAVVPGCRIAIKPRQAEPVQRRAAPPRTRLAVALQLDRPSARHRLSRLLALAAVDAIDHHELRPTPVAARYAGRLSGNTISVALLPRRCHLSAFARGRNSLRDRDSPYAPERIRTSDLRFRRPTLYPAELRAQGNGQSSHRAPPRSPAERAGFEPAMELSAPYSLSRRVPSATRPPLRGRAFPDPPRGPV